MSSLPITIRPATPADQHLIISSYLKSQRQVGQNTYMRDAVYYEHATPIIHHILNTNTIIVAANADDEWQAFGWVAFKPPTTISYIYIKYPYRRFGLATQLINTINPHNQQLTATHTCRIFTTLANKFNLTYNPNA